MPKIHAWDFVLLASSIFGLNQGYTGRYDTLGPRITWILGILNFCINVTVMYFMIKRQYFDVEGDSPINYIFRMMYFYLAVAVALILRIRCLSRRHKMAPVGRELSHLRKMSTWGGDMYGCVARLMIYPGTILLHEFLPGYQKDTEGWHVLAILCYWVSFAPIVATELLGQAMMLFQHEFNVLCKIAEDMAAKGNYKMEELRALNQRHASLVALSNAVAEFTGLDSLLIIETARLLILITVSTQINGSMTVQTDWGGLLFTSGCYLFRMQSITHHCFRGHRIITEADRFASTLDEFDPLGFENDEFFTEFQILRKQVRLRKLQFDCNRFLQLDMKLVFRISKHILTLAIILVQLTADPTIGTSTPENATLADNVTEYFLGFSEMQSNLSN